MEGHNDGEAGLREVFGSLLDPVSEDDPCGPDLYAIFDLDYLALVDGAKPKRKEPAITDGKLIVEEEPPNWSQLGKQARELLARSKDIRVLAFLARSLVQRHAARGLEDVFSLLMYFLKTWPEHVHPRLAGVEDGDFEERFLAVNSFVTNGLLDDIRNIPLSDSLLSPLKVLDAERSLGFNRPVDAIPPESVKRQLAEMRDSDRDNNYKALVSAAASLARLESFLADQYGRGPEKPDLTIISDLLRLIISAPSDIERSQEQEIAFSPQPAEPPVNSEQALINGRLAAVESINRARLWFEKNEPSSPIPILLKQAEALVGKNFIETVQSLPLEVMEKWHNAD